MNRDPQELAGREFDLAIIGAGIHGSAAAWAAAQAGLRVALIERADFGGGASANSLKIIHGGFRYLQHANFRRMRESIRCRRRFMRWAPSLVCPRAFLVPTWGSGVRGRALMRCALHMNDLVAWDRNRGCAEDSRLPSGRLVSRSELASIMPGELPPSWTGGAMWFDAFAADTERLTLSFVLAAADRGAQVANYAEVLKVNTRNNAVAGLSLRDVLSGRTHELACRAVINASGDSIDALAGDPGGRRWIKSWNLVVHRRWFGSYGIGLEGKVDHVDPDAVIQRGRRNFFFAPWREGTIIGTVYREAGAGRHEPALSAGEMDETLSDINAVFPAAGLSRKDVVMAHVGFLPGHPNPAMTHEVDKHSEILDARQRGGAGGLFTVKGVKYTTGLDVGLRAVSHAFAFLGKAWREPPEVSCPPRFLAPADPQRAVREEGAVRLADLVFRREGGGSYRRPSADALRAAAAATGALLHWDEARQAAEIAEVQRIYVALSIDAG